ncbi:integrase [Bradyrhizobium japonicum]|nr:integrase [Bradyrhizobium japonicum]MBR0990554.1 integrase [Bradyrhizobium japonicum]
MTYTGLRQLETGEKLYKRGDRDGIDVAVLPITKRKQIWTGGDHTFKVMH